MGVDERKLAVKNESGRLDERRLVFKKRIEVWRFMPPFGSTSDPRARARCLDSELIQISGHQRKLAVHNGSNSVPSVSELRVLRGEDQIPDEKLAPSIHCINRSGLPAGRILSCPQFRSAWISDD